jgi:hypothetical protein
MPKQPFTVPQVRPNFERNYNLLNFNQYRRLYFLLD